ncbi:MAG: hypothetical protein F4093_04420 [Gammaproteobacteria bacterium]|nr:hypothetical protein [Gammaproteobacteria bacterium]MYJ51901.1 hypothetical protein [Gammaproteobacteria bacterium]
MSRRRSNQTGRIPNMTDSRDTSRKKPVSARRKTSVRKRSTGPARKTGRSRPAASDATPAAAGAGVETGRKGKAESTKGAKPASVQSADSGRKEDDSIPKEETGKSLPSPEPVSEGKKPADGASVLQASRQSAGSAVDAPRASRGGHAPALAMASVALVLGVLAISAGGYAVYVSQFDSKLERLRQHDQLELLEQRADALQASQSALELGVTSLRASSAELETANHGRLLELREQLSSQEDTIRQLDALSNDQWSSEIESLRERMADLSSDMSAIQAQLERGMESWTMEEIEQLVRVADYRLRFTGEGKLALDALQIASDRLATLNNPAYAELKRLLARDVEALDDMEPVDTLALLGTLRILNDRVAFLPLAGDISAGAAGEEESRETGSRPASTAPADQQTGPFRFLADAGARILDSLGDLVQVEKNGRPVRPIISGEMRQLVYERTRLLLESAEAALVRQQSSLFRERVEVTKSWISENFDLTADATADWLELLDDVAEDLPAGAVPDLSESLEALHAAMGRQRG